MVSSEEENDIKSGDTVQWDVNMEIQLFYAMANHKPVGINKHFQMACIREKLSNSIAKEISTQDIWKHLETLYDLSMLVDTEPIPFPNHEIPFSLPESEFGALLKHKCKEVIATDDNEGSRKDSISATKVRKESGSSHASTDTPSIKSEKDYDRRRDSRDSNASGPRDSSSGRKSTLQRDKIPKPKVGSIGESLKVGAVSKKLRGRKWMVIEVEGDKEAWDSPLIDEDSVARRGRRRTNTSTPPATTPAKRRRT